MREIKFRGIYPHHELYENKEKWVYGYLLYDKDNDEYYIQEDNDSLGECILILKETRGQYTGLKDKNGKEIYEGDIAIDDSRTIVEIIWTDHHQWGCKVIRGCTLTKGLTFPLWHWDKCRENGYRKFKVIGNIYEYMKIQS
ncbi:hypothetical protein GOQ29_04040 [Clostridium sp. D2Q-14]|uniref:YopX family protein n=1 Tax=Anaeromonas gelatinilytica TaxID=2683194 RepID=UPI00193B909A|nr:YopX family protein [Anaeromonas gelatinilytica]MBS4534783.1 hypothetical protein [Anaeromonas gelatinilytica]